MRRSSPWSGKDIRWLNACLCLGNSSNSSPAISKLATLCLRTAPLYSDNLVTGIYPRIWGRMVSTQEAHWLLCTSWWLQAGDGSKSTLLHGSIWSQGRKRIWACYRGDWHSRWWDVRRRGKRWRWFPEVSDSYRSKIFLITWDKLFCWWNHWWRPWIRAETLAKAKTNWFQGQ